MRRILSGLCLLILAGLAACGHRDQNIKIGYAGVLTGPDGQLGTKTLNGSIIALDEWNAKGGVLGKKVEIIQRDDEGKPNQAAAVAHELCGSGIVAVIGHFNSGCTIPASTIYHENHVLEITPASTDPEVTEHGIPTLFRLCGRDDQQGRVSAEYAATKLGLKKVAILHNKTAYGQGLAEEFKRRFTELGGTVTSFVGVPEEELNFRADISRIKSEGIDGIFWGGMYGQGGPLFNQLREAGENIPFISGDGCFEQEFVNTVGNNAQGAFLSFGPDYTSKPEVKPFLEAYRKKFGTEGPYSIYGYEAMNILLGAIRESGSTNPQKLAETIRSHSWDTTMGTVQFDAKGDLTKANFIIWTIRDGKLVPVE